MVNLTFAVLAPPDYHPVWRQELIKSMSPLTNEGCKGVLVDELKIYMARYYETDEKLFLSKLKTYNNMDHEGGAFRAWNPKLNQLARFIRGLLGLGIVPITPSYPVNLPGHIIILARTEDKKDKNGREHR